MAVTKTHPIKSTLKAAIDYICNPEKTDGKLLVSAYGCAAETADIEFSWTRRHAIDKGTNLGRHLIQAFQPGEVTPEQTHEIGMELAKEILGGKYEFVLTTHIDKNHVHNHLIFNAVSFAAHKHYHSNKRSYHDIRRTSDRLCKEHGLSVIIPGQDKGKSYIEHQATQNGISYKAKLKAAIDRLLPDCSDLEELLRRLQREGYEIKRGKYISARAPDQERFTRLKTLGVDYTEEALAARIAGRSRPSRQPKQRGGRVSLLIDIQNNIKAQQSAGYRHWATIENLKRIAETSNFLTEHGIGSMEELTERCEAASAALLYCIFRSACVKNGELDYLWLWILCGLPFGIWRLRLWIIPGGGSLGGGIALFLLNFVFAGLIGGCVLVWRLLVAAWYVPLTLYRLLTAGCACIITED